MKKYRLLLVLFFSFLSLATFAQSYIVQVKTESGKWGYTNLKGEMVIPAQFETCNPFAENGLAVVMKGKTFVVINTKGEEVPTDVKGFLIIQGAFGIGTKGYQEGLLAVQLNKKWGFIDGSGKTVIPLKYDYVTAFESGFAIAKIGEKFLILDSKGTEIAISAPGVVDVKHFSEGLAPVKTADKKMGFINGKGEMVIESQYNSVGYFVGGYAWAKTIDSKVGFINPKGEWVVKPTYEAGNEFDPIAKLARVKEAGSWLYVDATGNKVYVTDTESWGDFAEGFAKGKKTDKVGFYNNKGAWVIKPQFDGTREFKNGYAAAKQGEKWGVIDTAGKWVLNPTFDGIKDVERIK